LKAGSKGEVGGGEGGCALGSSLRVAYIKWIEIPGFMENAIEEASQKERSILDWHIIE
jgi:hypothetical protein